jgi:hypothetical protein
MKKRILSSFALFCLLGANEWADAKLPTHYDILYSAEYERSKIDL